MKFKVFKLRTIFASLLFLMLCTFSLFAQTYNVLGTIKDENGAPLSDVTITFTGWNLEKTTTTDDNGYYILSELPAGTTGTIAPSKTDYRFNPYNGFVSLLNANKEINFTGTKIPGYYSVSGTIRHESGVPVSGVEITIGCYGVSSIELVKSTTSDENGYYIISDLPAGCVNYILTPRSDDYYFEYIVFQNLDSNMTLDLTCRDKQFYSISGTVKEANGTPISGVEITLSETGYGRTVTDINGFYILSDLVEGEGLRLIRPDHNDYYFDPRYVMIQSLNSNLTQDFIGTKKVIYIQLSGTIKDENGVPMNGITVNLSNGGEIFESTTTDINGFYSFQNVVPGNYSITPLKYGFMFNPTSIYIREANTDATNLDFIGHERSLYTVSGTIKDAGNKPISDVLVILYAGLGGTPDTTTTDINGFYIFPDLFSEVFYTVTPSHTNYYFDPWTRVFDALVSDRTDADFIGKEVYKISCKIIDASNQVIDGATVQLSGDVSETMTTVDEFGYYTFAKLPAGGNYTITPSCVGYSFEPSSITITSLNSDQTPTFTAKVISIDKLDELPNSYSLEQNYPNPFNPSTKIKYTIKESGFVSLKVFDIFGREARKLVNTFQPSGNYEITFDAKGLTSGVYYYKININEFTATKKMLLMK